MEGKVIKMMGMAFGGLGMIIFWVVILGGAVYLIKYLAPSDKIRRQERSSLEILKSRYAAGEISSEEYKQLRNDLLRT